MKSLLLIAAALLLGAAASPGQGLDTPTLLLMVTAIVGVVLLRGVLLRRHLRKRRPTRRPQNAGDRPAPTDSAGAERSETGADLDGRDQP